MIMGLHQVHRPIVTRPGTASYPFHYGMAALVLGHVVPGSPCGSYDAMLHDRLGGTKPKVCGAC